MMVLVLFPFRCAWRDPSKRVLRPVATPGLFRRDVRKDLYRKPLPYSRQTAAVHIKRLETEFGVMKANTPFKSNPSEGFLGYLTAETVRDLERDVT